jgi:hypothetical protein
MITGAHIVNRGCRRDYESPVARRNLLNANGLTHDRQPCPRLCVSATLRYLPWFRVPYFPAGGGKASNSARQISHVTSV